MCVTLHFDGAKWVEWWFPVWRYAPQNKTSAHNRTARTHVMCACMHDVMCVCVYACAYVCTCVCVCAYMHVCTYVRTYVRSLMYMRTCMRAWVHILMCVCVCVYVHAWRVYVRAMCTWYVHVCMRACLQASKKLKSSEKSIEMHTPMLVLNSFPLSYVHVKLYILPPTPEYATNFLTLLYEEVNAKNKGVEEA